VRTSAELINDANDELFDKLRRNPHHVLCNILPNETVSRKGAGAITENF